MDLVEILKQQMTVINNLRARIEVLESRDGAEFSFVTDSLAFSIAALLARDAPEYRDHIIGHCNIVQPPAYLDKDAVGAGFKSVTDFLRDPDKKRMPNLFRGVVDGGKGSELEDIADK